MKIGINLIPFESIQGIEVYAKNIISRLLKTDEEDDFYIFATHDLPELLEFEKAKIIRVDKSKSKFQKAFYQQLGMYRLLRKNNIDMLFSPSPIAPIFYNRKVIVVHDCAYNKFPDSKNLLPRLYYRLMLFGAKHFSKKIITVSEFSKKELDKIYKVDPNKVEVVYEGAPELEKVNEDFTRQTLKSFKINKPYFLFLGKIRRRKNIKGLLEGFSIFVREYPEFKLVLAGKPNKESFDVASKAEELGIADKIIQTGFVSEKEEVALYKKAEALTFPSFYEGFGLPILEAQSLEAPVLASNSSSLPEAAGEGALYVDPYDVNDIAQGMREITSDKKLRQELTQKGLGNIERFSWNKAARKTLNILKS